MTEIEAAPQTEPRHSLLTSMGNFGLVASSQGLRQVSWLKASEDWGQLSTPLLDQAVEALQDFLRGEVLAPLALPLDFSGLSPFRRKVMQVLARKIPPGQLISYGDLAMLAGHPGAARAVGSVMSRNPIPIFVPCHRVIGATGPGGFGPGLEIKRKLLALEGTELLL